MIRLEHLSSIMRLRGSQVRGFNCASRTYAKPSYRVPRNDPQIIKEIEHAIQNNQVQRQKLPIATRIGVILIPTVLIALGVVGFNAYHGEATYIPMLFQKRVQISEENSYGVDLAKLKELTMSRLTTKLSINGKFQQLVGLPITSQSWERFDVFLQYKTLMSSGINITPNEKPYVSWTSRQYSINHEKLNEYLEPMGISDSEFQFQVINNPAASVRDYKIVVEGRMQVNGNELFKITGRDCDVNFKGVIDFDHSQNIRFEEVTLCYKDSNGVVKVETLF